MTPSNPDERLNQINTLWSVVRQAHQDTGEKAHAARRALLERYGGAIRRYLLGALRDEEAANDLAQDFAYRFLHGDLRGADPQRGRFRDFVKGVLFHLIANHHKKQQRRPRQMPDDHPEPAVEPPSVMESDNEFLASWRDELLARCWAGLEEVERRTGQPFHTTLRFRAEHPDLPSPRIAEELSARLEKPLTAAGVRQTLHRARDKFADLLLDAVTQSMDVSSAGHVEQELIDLGLLEYCRPALQRRRE
jgi:RNA polymerase sigma factor (sigma-70 family)